MSEDCLCTAFNSPLPLCGKPSCITLYRGENCYFCDIASQMLASAVTQYGVSTDVLREVDIDSQEDVDSETQIVALPTIRICDVVLSGLPEEDIINDAVIRVLMKDCFSEHSAVHQTTPLCNTRSLQVTQKSI